MLTKRGLGRGLGALLSSEPTEAEALVDVALDQIEVNPNQPRKVFDFTALDELAASIKATGAQSIELALVENLLREDLNPIEAAQAYQKLLAEFAWTQEELAQRIGKDRTSIANCLRLLRLPEEIQADLRSGRLTMGHARALLALPTVSEQLKLRDEILTHDWSVRTTEDSIRAKESLAGARGLAPRKGRRRSVEMAALEEAIQRGLMTRVRIIGNERKGKIEVSYATADELERLADLLG